MIMTWTSFSLDPSKSQSDLVLCSYFLKLFMFSRKTLRLRGLLFSCLGFLKKSVFVLICFLILTEAFVFIFIFIFERKRERQRTIHMREKH